MRRGVALITGASSGLGLLSAVALAERGFRVFATMREPARAGALREALARAHQDAEIVALDVAEPAAIDAAVELVLDRVGAVDVLVNNAGVMWTGFVEEVAEEELRAQFETNFFGLVRLTRALLPAMRERRHGRIINISSIGGRFATPGHGAYHAAKFAVEGLSESLRYELYPYNVFVSLVEPGVFPTEIFGRNRAQAAGAKDPSSPYHRTSLALERLSERFRRHMAGADPGAVAEVVARIALAERPRLRYPVGLDAWASHACAAALPRSWERLMVSLFRR